MFRRAQTALVARSRVCPSLFRRLRLLFARAQIRSNAKQTNILISLRIYSPRFTRIVDAKKVLKILSSIPVSHAFFHPIRATTKSSFACRFSSCLVGALILRDEPSRDVSHFVCFVKSSFYWLRPTAREKQGPSERMNSI